MSDIYFDRSRTAQDDACPRSRYWGVEYEGIGLELQGNSSKKHYLEFGSSVHRGMELLAQGLSPQDAYKGAVAVLRPVISSPLAGGSDDYSLYVKELEYLLAGFIIGYGSTIFQDDLAEYEMIGVEDEIVVEWTGASGIKARVSTKPDLVMRRRRDKSLWYKEFKTTSIISEGWIRSWSRSAQLLLGGLGVQQKHGEPLRGSIIQALYKGGKYKGRSTSVFCRAYSAPDGRVTLNYSKGFQATPVWELGFTPEAWVEHLLSTPAGTEAIRDQFPSTPPILFNMPLLKQWLEERVLREGTIAESSAIVNDPIRVHPDVKRQVVMESFPMHTGSCESSFGDPCPFVGLCYNETAADAPLTHGYQWRTPHLRLDPANLLLKAKEIENGETQGDD